MIAPDFDRQLCRNHMYFSMLTSHTTTPVLGSLMAGTRPGRLSISQDFCQSRVQVLPFGLSDTKGSFLTSPNSMNSVSYGIESSSRKMATFHGFGPMKISKHVRLGL